MQPKFITFIHCTFDKDKWYSAPASDAGPDENMAMRNMTVFCSIVDGAKINLVDMNVKEVRIQFRSGVYVGIGNGMLYCKADDVLDTQIRDTPPEYTDPNPSHYTKAE